MDLDRNITQSVYNKCIKSLDFNVDLGDEYFYSSLSLCVLDSIFSINSKYESVKYLVDRYCDYFELPKTKLRDSKIVSKGCLKSTEGVSDFIDKFDFFGLDFMTNEVLKNRQRTSPINGILKSEACYMFAKLLKEFEVEDFGDLYKLKNNIDFEGRVKSIPGQRSGISLRYFFMLCGNDELIKPDRMIKRFLFSCTGVDFSDEDCLLILSEVCNKLHEKCGSISVRKLDYVIWNYMRDKINN